MRGIVSWKSIFAAATLSCVAMGAQAHSVGYDHTVEFSIDFETGFADGEDITDVNIGGVTLSRGGDLLLVTETVPDAVVGGLFSVWGSPFTSVNPIRFDFFSVVAEFHLDVGDFGPSDADVFTLNAYSGTGTLVDSETVNFSASDSGFATLTVSESLTDLISYATLSSTSSGGFPGSFFIDNLVFDVEVPGSAPSPVPLPAGFVLLGTALAGLRLSRRRA